jgi:hypothetical protein
MYTSPQDAAEGDSQMKVKTLISSLSKVPGIQIERIEDDGCIRGRAEIHGKASYLWWIENGESVKFLSAAYHDLIDDSQTDLFYSWCPRTIKQAKIHMSQSRDVRLASVA